MEYFVHIGGERLRVELDRGSVRVDGEPVAIEMEPPRGHPVRSVRVDGRAHRVLAERNGKGSWRLDLDGQRHEAEVLDRGQEAIRAARLARVGTQGPTPLVAPMPGLVLKIEVSVGDVVTEGQGIAIVEAMKMENELEAPVAARVSAVRVGAGDTVEKGEILVEFESPGGPEAAEAGA